MARIKRLPVREVDAGPMRAGEYRSAIQTVGLTQMDAARFFRAAPRTSRKWAGDAAPVHSVVAMLLRYMVREGLTPSDIDPNFQVSDWLDRFGTQPHRPRSE